MANRKLSVFSDLDDTSGISAVTVEPIAAINRLIHQMKVALIALGVVIFLAAFVYTILAFVVWGYFPAGGYRP